MITESQVVPLLRAACPSFEGRWQAYVSDSLFDDVCWGFASHLVDLMVEGKVAEFAAVFDAVERLLVDGDLYVRQAATVGLLEGIQNVSGGGGGSGAVPSVCEAEDSTEVAVAQRFMEWRH